MRFWKIINLLIVVFFICSCGEMERGDSGFFIQPKYGFNKLIEGKSVKMIDVFEEQVNLVISDSSKLSVQFKKTAGGEQLIVNDWIYNYEKAIKYKRYYFLHHLVDSSFYEVIVVGRYFSKYYGFKEAEQQNLSVWTSIGDTMGDCILRPLKIDSLSNWNFVITPKDKKTIKEYYQVLLKNTFLRKEPVKDAVVQEYGTDPVFFDNNEVKDVGDLKIFPNPVSGNELTIKADLLNVDGAILYISDVSGEKVDCKQFQGYKSIKVNVADLQAGIYFVIIESGSKLLSSQFIVIK
mgnify:FL=1|tara:strand:+ start:830 stop:1708 length:879 start_codon:yes stop_codon:yes gene_type:complete